MKVSWLGVLISILTLVVAGEWIKCEEVYVKLKESREFLETMDFLVDGAAPTTFLIRLGIKIQGPSMLYELKPINIETAVLESAIDKAEREWDTYHTDRLDTEYWQIRYRVRPSLAITLITMTDSYLKILQSALLSHWQISKEWDLHYHTSQWQILRCYKVHS